MRVDLGKKGGGGAGRSGGREAVVWMYCVREK